ncbi:MAG TPA: DinB family protein, partial [Longimicrobiales bacterium]
RLRYAALATLFATSFAPAAVRGQAHPPGHQGARPAVVDALLRDLAAVERKMTSLVEAMPATAYDWRPGEGVRSSGEVVMHVAADNYFLPTAKGVAAPEASGIRAGEYATVQAYETRTATKAEALQEMRASFAHLRTAVEQTDEAFLGSQIDLFGNRMSGLDLWVLTTTHLHEHLGQLIAYARANGVAPPWSQ